MTKYRITPQPEREPPGIEAMFSLGIIILLTSACIYLYSDATEARTKLIQAETRMEIMGLAPEPDYTPPEMPARKGEK